jgi:hypothetical protein
MDNMIASNMLQEWVAHRDSILSTKDKTYLQKIINGLKKYTISLDEVEQENYDAFTKEHYSKHKFRGGVPATLTPTGLGINIEVKCPKCAEVKNISNFESW